MNSNPKTTRFKVRRFLAFLKKILGLVLLIVEILRRLNEIFR